MRGALEGVYLIWTPNILRSPLISGQLFSPWRVHEMVQGVVLTWTRLG